MISLLLSILFTSCLIIFFRHFERFGINAFQAIVVNYFTAGTMGIMLTDIPEGEVIANSPLLKIAIPLGILFISVFYTISYTTRKLGISAATIANKMSLIIPVLVALFLYNDSIGILKTAGILLALAAVYLAVKKENTGQEKTAKTAILPALLVFAGSGIIDSIVNYTQQRYLQGQAPDLFLSMAFYSAGITGLVILIYQLVAKQVSFPLKNVIAGISLGIPNYLSIYFLVKTLNDGKWESSVIYPVNNIGIVVVSILYSVLVFHEKLSLLNKLGIGLAILSIALMNYP